MFTRETVEMNPYTAARLFIAMLLDPKLDKQAKDRLAEQWNEDVRRNRELRKTSQKEQKGRGSWQ